VQFSNVTCSLESCYLKLNFWFCFGNSEVNAVNRHKASFKGENKKTTTEPADWHAEEIIMEITTYLKLLLLSCIIMRGCLQIHFNGTLTGNCKSFNSSIYQFY
jgi:hypothetical protein